MLESYSGYFSFIRVPLNIWFLKVSEEWTSASVDPFSFAWLWISNFMKPWAFLFLPLSSFKYCSLARKLRVGRAPACLVLEILPCICLSTFPEGRVGHNLLVLFSQHLAQCRHVIDSSRTEPNVWYSKYCECSKLHHKQGRDVTIVSCCFSEENCTVWTKTSQRRLQSCSLITHHFLPP